MILYQLDNGQFVGTQEEAKKAHLAWRKVDVPTTKPELLDYLNGFYITNPRRDPQPASGFVRCPQCDQTERLAQFKADLLDLRQVQQFIGDSSPEIFFGVLDAVISRFTAMKETPNG